MVTLLIVEDNAKELNLCVETLGSHGDGINLIAPQSAEGALGILSERTIDGIFVDIELPGIDGLSLVKRIRKIEKYHFLPVMFVSGTDNDSAETFKQYHNFNFISKPYSKAELLKVSLLFIKEIEKQKKLFRIKDEREVVFRSGENIIRFRFSDLLFATTEGRRLKLVTRQNEYLRSDVSLRNLITELNDSKFVLCSQSAAVNVINIEKISPTEYSYKSWTIHFIDAPDKTCQLSLKNKKKIENLLEK
jgi:DNA-binding LytR/AlgR family response regulator